MGIYDGAGVNGGKKSSFSKNSRKIKEKSFSFRYFFTKSLCCCDISICDKLLYAADVNGIHMEIHP